MRHTTLVAVLLTVGVLKAASARAEDGLVRIHDSAPKAVQEQTPPHPGGISLSLDDVELVDMLRMMTRIASVSLTFDPKDPAFSQRASVNVQNKPWKPFLSSVLAQHGLLLVEDSPGSQTYSIIRPESPDAATRIRAARDAIELVDAVLADLNAGDLAAVRDRLTKYREYNAALIPTAHGRREEPANQPSEATR